MNQSSQSTVEASGTDSGSQPLLALKGFTKSFGAVEALKDVDLELYAGEVVGLVGDNGAGKSTLIKAIAGAQPAGLGRGPVREGSQVTLTTPHAATGLGIATVYQDLALAENLDVVANLFLGQEVANTLPGVSVLDEAAMEQKSVELLELARGDDAAQRPHRGRHALRRPAPGGGDRPLAARRAEGGAARRADRGARRSCRPRRS